MHYTLPPLPRVLIEPLVRAAFLEDLGRAGDVTTDSVVPADARFSAVIGSRQPGVIAGIDVAVLAFHIFDPTLEVIVERVDGTRVTPGDVVLRLEGSARSILTAERVALNLACRLSGVATATASLVAAAKPFGPAHIVCTRKTTPGLRALEKHAVVCGGGANHRLGLDGGVMIKDNHIAVAGSIRGAVARAREKLPVLTRIEVECDRLEQVSEALEAGADLIMLDNMSNDDMRRAVAMVGGRVPIEASGGIALETIRAKAETGVDYLSTSKTHQSAPAVDIGLDET